MPSPSRYSSAARSSRGTREWGGLYWFSEEQRATAEASRTTYDQALRKAGRNAITTEVLAAPAFYFAEEYHQQYLEKNPDGYCGLGGTGVSCPIGVGVTA